jgi:DNA-binding IclR family transcriptional regulator
MSLSEISRTTGLSLTTAHRLIAELVSWGGLERDADGQYRVGLRLFELGALAPRGNGLVETALPYLQDLYEASHENVRMGVRVGSEVMFIAHLAGRTSVPLRTRAATRLPMPTTGVGLVLLAYAPEDVFQSVLASPLPKFTPYTVASESELRQLLNQVRRDGYAICDRQMTDHAVAVAAPVRSPSGEVIAAVSVAVHGDGPQAVRGLTAAIQVTARRISRALERPKAVRRVADS